MNTYAALLRGINVGGKNIIKMDALRVAFENMGFQSVKTYIQSGNVLFQSDMADKAKIEIKIEKALALSFKYAAKVLVRSYADLEKTVAHFPKIFENPDWKHNVIFLSTAIDSKAIVKQFVLKENIEMLTYYPGVLFWSAEWKSATRSTMIKLSSYEVYQEMTVRNVNTTRKILELMSAM